MWQDNFKKEMRRVQKRMSNLFSGVDEPFVDEEWGEDYRRAWADFLETENEFIIAVELPGVEKDDIELNIDEKLLTIKASKKQEKEEKDEEKYSYSRSYAGFARSITLPEAADVENINAEFRNGVLKIKIPKRKV